MKKTKTKPETEAVETPDVGRLPSDGVPTGFFTKGAKRAPESIESIPSISSTPSPSSALSVVPTSGPVLSDSQKQLAETASHINAVWAEVDGELKDKARKVVAIGLMLVYTSEWGEKEKLIKHGQFGPWLEKNCPAVHQATAYRWMQTAREICNGLEISHDAKFGDLPLYQALTIPEDAVSEAARDIRNKVFSLIDGKSQKQLMWDLKDMNPKKAGGFKVDEKKLQKWLKKNHPELVGTEYPKLPPKIQKEYRRYQLTRKPLTPDQAAKEAARLGEESLTDVCVAIDTGVINNKNWPYASKETQKKTLLICEEGSALLRKALSGESPEPAQSEI